MNDAKITTDRPGDSKFAASLTIVGLGEVLWDLFPDGAMFGGAPANFACTTAGIAGPLASASIVSAVGDDDLGRQAIEALQARSVDTSVLKTVEQATGQVLVSLDAEGKASYEIAANAAWDQVAWAEDLKTLANTCDAVCFGTLGQRSPVSRATLRRFVTETSDSCLRILDVNLRPPFYNDEVIDQSLQLANVLKLNDEELPELARQYELSGNHREILWQLKEMFQLQCVALTMGSAGALLVRDDEFCEVAGSKVRVVDTVGAGDAFTAALALGLLQNTDLQKIAKKAVDVAAYVCTQTGATPVIPEELHA